MPDYDDSLEDTDTKDAIDNYPERTLDTSINDGNHVRTTKQEPQGNSHEPLTGNSERATQEPQVSESNIQRGATQDSSEIQKAIEQLTRAIQLDPTNEKAHRDRAASFRALGKYQKAIDDFSTSITLGFPSAEVYLQRGHLNQYLFNSQKAIGDYSKAIELDPMFLDAYYSRGALLTKLGEHPKALEDLCKVIEVDPDSAEAYSTRAELYRKTGDTQAAIEDFSKAISESRIDFQEKMNMEFEHV